MNNIKDYTGREVKINDREGEITDILGVHWYEITFFNSNDGKIRMPIEGIEKYFV